MFNYINMTNPDTSGMLRFLTDELQSAEDAGDRGMVCYPRDAAFLKKSDSMDFGTCPHGMGWRKSSSKPYQFV